MTPRLEEPFISLRLSDIDFAKDKILARFESEAPESEELEQLIKSVKKYRILEPIIVRLKDNKRYEVIAGNRRLRAARIAKLETIPVIVKEFDDIHSRRIAYIENAIRKELNSMQKAKGIAAIYEDIGVPKEKAIQIVKHYWNSGAENNKSDLARVGSKIENKEKEADFIDAFLEISSSSNLQYQLLQLVTQLPEPTQQVLEDTPKLSLGKANLLTHSKLQKYPEIQTYLANKIKNPKITIAQAKAIVDQAIHDTVSGELEIEKDRETGESHVTKGSGDLSEDIREEPELEKTFDMLIPEMMHSIKQTIGKILQRPLSKGQLIYTEEIYKPKLAELERNLRRVKKTDKKWIASQAAVLIEVCKVVVDSAK